MLRGYDPGTCCSDTSPGLSICSENVSSPVMPCKASQSCGATNLSFGSASPSLFVLSKTVQSCRKPSVSTCSRLAPCLPPVPVDDRCYEFDCRLAGLPLPSRTFGLSTAVSGSSAPVSSPEPSAFAMYCRPCQPTVSSSSVSVSESLAFASPCCSSCKPVVCSSNSGFVFKSSDSLCKRAFCSTVPSVSASSVHDSSLVSPVVSSPRVLPSLVRSSVSSPVCLPRVLPSLVRSLPKFFVRLALLPLFVPGFGFAFVVVPLLFWC